MSAYGTDDGFTAWLAANGLALPSGAPTAAVLRAVGSAYVDALYSPRLTCSAPTGGFSQALAWPRTGAKANKTPVPDDVIPLPWITAAYRAGYLHALNPGWATDSSDPNRVTRREKVDVIEREYFAASETAGAAKAAPGAATDALIDAMVTPFLCSGKRGFDDLFRVV